jgi:hypothetical protein
MPLKATQEGLEIERAELTDEGHDKELVYV